MQMASSSSGLFFHVLTYVSKTESFSGAVYSELTLRVSPAGTKEIIREALSAGAIGYAREADAGGP